jgi:hypothetical protein
MAEVYEKIANPSGSLQEIKVNTSTMSQRYREQQPAINKTSQDTLPDRE